MTKQRRDAGKVFAGIALAFTLVGAACSATANPTDTSEPNTTKSEQVEVTLMLDWSWGSEHLGFLIADEKGYFADANLNVTLRESDGSVVTAQAVSAGEVEFGAFSAGETLAGISKGMNLSPLAQIAQESPTSVVFDKDTVSIFELSDLDGLDLGVIHESTTYKEWEALVDMKNYDVTNITEVAVGQAAVQALLAGDVDAFIAWSFNQGIQSQVEGANSDWIYLSELGMPELPNVTLVSNSSYRSENPEVVREVTDAVLKGWRYVSEKPEDSLDLLFDKQPRIDREYNANKLPVVLELMGAPAEYGKFSVDAWQDLHDLYQNSGLLDKPIDVHELFEDVDPEYIK